MFAEIATMLSYNFIQRALIVGVFTGLAMAAIGMVTVLRRQSMIGDALSHTTLAGVALGLVLSFNPVITAIIIAVLAAFAIELFRRFFPQFSEMAIAIVMAAGIGLAGVLSGFVTAANFNAYLFGSIITIPNLEFWVVIISAIVVLLLSLCFYRALFMMGFDPEAAVLAGVQVSAIHVTMTFLTAITIAIAARAVGTLVVSAQLVLPVASALQWAKSYKGTFIFALTIGVIESLLGLTLSYFWQLKPGGTIVLTSVICLIICLLAGQIRKKWRLNRRKQEVNDA